jgi:hypothetical protein
MRLSRRARVIVIALAVVAGRGIPPGSLANGAVLDRCGAAKMKAAGKAVYANAKCHQRAMLAGLPVDTACLANVASKLATAIAKADALGPCPGTSDALDETASECIDAVVADVATTTTPTSSTTTTSVAAIESCCQGTSLCTQVATPDGCTPFGGSMGPAGSVCDPSTGACGTTTVTAGPCCQIIGSLCLAGPTLDETTCTRFDGTFFPTATCTPSGCAP